MSNTDMSQSETLGAKPASALSETMEIVKTVVYALLIALVLRTILFQPFTIPSASMEPNLYEGDFLIVTKWDYGYSKHSIQWSPPLFKGRLFNKAPAQGDIVVFKTPADNNTDYIKRVIGLPGDTVQMKNNQLYINDTLVPLNGEEKIMITDAFSAIEGRKLSETLPGGRVHAIQDIVTNSEADNTEAFTVPEGHYFVMGDNRDNSLDSRFGTDRGGVGFVPAENLVGRARFVVFSYDKGAALWNPVSWFTKFRSDRFMKPLK
ncbi:MAG: signal peptidase I [Asticcacaulis sp.]